jgi:hypothetical protein
LELGAWSLELGAWSLELGAWSLELGETYPEPIIDHKHGRERALAAYASARSRRISLQRLFNSLTNPAIVVASINPGG